MRRAHYRTIYRVLSTGHKPTRPVRFEIAAAFGLLPGHIWGELALPAWVESEQVAA